MLVFPIWTSGSPAILKGFSDRVFLPDLSFHLQKGKAGQGLQNIKALASVTTCGGARRRSFLAGDRRASRSPARSASFRRPGAQLLRVL